MKNLLLVFFTSLSLFSKAQTLAGYNLVDCVDSVVGVCSQVDYIKGYPNDSTWVNFNANTYLSVYFNQAWVADLGDELLFETSFHKDFWEVQLILTNGNITPPITIDTSDWTSLPNTFWHFKYANNCSMGGLTNAGRQYIALDFLQDFGLTTTDHVIGAKIKLLSTPGYPDFAGAYITQYAFPAPDCEGPHLIDSSYCSNGPLILDAGINDSTASFLWNTGDTDSILNISQSGFYSVLINTTYCIIEDSAFINITPSYNLDLGNDTLLCEGQSLTLNLQLNTTPTNYLWSDGSTASNLNITNDGSFWLTVSDSVCTSSDTINVSFAPYPEVNLGNDTSFCNQLIAYLYNTVYNQNTSYTWNDGSQTDTLGIDNPGTYWLTASNGSCTSVDTISVNFADYPTLDLGEDTSICPGEVLTYDFTNQAQTLLWSDGSTSPQNSFNNTQNIWVIAANESCAIEDSIALWITEPIHFTLPEYLEVCDDETVVLVVNSQNVNILWSNGSTDSILNVSQGGNYTLTLSNLCENLNFNTEIEFVNCNCPMFIPNTFTPNSDEHNTSFKPVIDCPISDYQFNIYNRWGQLIFSSTSTQSTWNGTYKGKECKEGVYIYVIHYTDAFNNKFVEKKGHINLIR